MEVKIKEIKKKIHNEGVFNRLVNSFKILSEKRQRDSKYASNFKITEQSIINNFHLLFDYKCDILAKLMYIKMSKRKDKSKIDFD